MLSRKKRLIYHPPYSKFMGYLKENGIKLQAISDLLNQTVQTISDKNNGRADYKGSEIDAICNRFGISADIFRTQKVANT